MATKKLLNIPAFIAQEKETVDWTQVDF